MKPEFTFRFAEPSDSEEFVKWATTNNKIPHKDVVAAMKQNNPTSVGLVIERDGRVVLFAPVYAQINLSFIGFNPEAKGKDRIGALEALKDVAAEFARIHGVEEITVQTSKDYPVGQWALKHGFTPETRQTFKFRARPIVDPFKVEEEKTDDELVEK